MKDYLEKIKLHEEYVNFAEDQQREHEKDMQQPATLEQDQEQQSDQTIESINRIKMFPLPKVPAPIEIRADPDLNFLNNSHMQEKK